MTKNRQIRRWLTAIFAVMILCTIALSVSAETDSGRCGSRLYWSYEGNTGTLSFTGTGAMFSYAQQNAPWLAYSGQIRKITFETGITTISDRAFYGCRALQTVQLPSTVTSVGASAFEDCISLTSLPLGTGSCTVGESAFRGCTGLKSLVIPSGITSVGAGAFEQCVQAQSLSIPASLIQIGKGAFRGCTALRQIDVAAGNPAFFDSGNCLITADGVLQMGNSGSVIPNDGSIHTIGADAFRDSVDMQTITIPNSVAVIEEYAFLGCTGLTQVKFGVGLTRVGLGAFQGCTGLTKITLPDGLKEIGTCAFSGCTALQEINFPQDLEILGSWSFSGTAIRTVTLSASVNSVGVNPFRSCQNLTAISVNYRNRNYKARGNCLISSSDKVLVSGCSASQIPASMVVAIGREAFRGVNISSIYIPDTIHTIEVYAFADSALTEFRLGAGVTKLQGNPLVGCKLLTAISVSEGNTVFRASGNCLMEGNTLVAGCKTSQFYGDVSVIGAEAFSGTTIAQITLAEGVTRIEKRAFFGCEELQLANLPDSLAYIGESAFELSGLQCLALGELPQIDSYAFLGCTGLNTIYTPDAAKLQPGSAAYGYIAYYAGEISDEEMPYVLHYIDDVLQGIYPSLSAAIADYTAGWLQLGCSLRETVTLKRDLYIDLAGFDLGGTMNTAGFKVFGMDSSTNDYTCRDTGLFTCVTPAGAAVVPQRHFQWEMAGQKPRYMAIAEGGGYSFHCFCVDLVYTTINVDRVGVGYKAVFRGDEKVHAQLDTKAAFSYELRLEGFSTLTSSSPAEEVVSGGLRRLLVYNYRVQEHGETPLSAWVSLKLADGTVISSPETKLTLRALTEYIDKNLHLLDARELDALLDMMDSFPVMKSWDVANILASA